MQQELPDDGLKVEPQPVSRWTSVWVWAVILIALTSLGFWYYGRLIDGFKSVQLLASHQLTQGVIYESGFPRSPAKYRVFIEGQSYTGQAGESPNKGDAIEIAYIPGQGHINRPTSQLWLDAVFGGLIVLAGPVLLLSILYGAYIDYRNRVERKALEWNERDGQDPLHPYKDWDNEHARKNKQHRYR